MSQVRAGVVLALSWTALNIGGSLIRQTCIIRRYWNRRVCPIHVSLTQTPSHERMYFFVFEASPKPSHQDYGVVDGAFVSCWVNEILESVAERIARTLVEQHGWDIHRRDQGYPLAEDHVPHEPSAIEYFKQARVDGAVAVFHRWDVGAPEE